MHVGIDHVHDTGALSIRLLQEPVLIAGNDIDGYRLPMTGTAER
jgi:hypothetical protein